MAVTTITYDVAYLSGSWTSLSAGSVLDVQVQANASSNRENALAFGEDNATSLTIKTTLDTWSVLTIDTAVRVQYTSGGTGTYRGILTQRQRDQDQATYQIESIRTRIQQTRAYSAAWFRRPVCTRTTATSIDNPATDGYAAGPINWVLWQAGGRPLEQAGTYPTALFYYSCDQALIAPDWTWLAGENGWDECLRLARAGGALLYVQPDGTVRARNPLTMISSSVQTYSESDWQSMDERQSNEQVMTRAQAAYTPRRLVAVQTVIDDSTPRLIANGASLTIPLEPQLPIATWVLDGSSLPADALTATTLDGHPVTTGLATSVTTAAQRLTLTVTNTTAVPVLLHRITVRGQPIAAGERGIQTSGGVDTDPTRTLEDSPYVQSAIQAQQLIDLSLAYYGTARSVRTVAGLPWAPNREPGTVVSLTCATWGLNAVAHLIMDQQVSQTGAQMDLTCLDITGLPVVGDYFQVGTTNYSGLTRRLGW
jgi:hypothetical protein